MGNIMTRYFNKLKQYAEIIETNQAEIKTENGRVLKDILLAGILIFASMFLATIVIEPERFLYVGFMVVGLASYMMRRYLEKILEKIDITIVQNILLTMVYLVATYVGIITNPNNYAVVLPVFFSLAPTIFLVKPKNMMLLFIVAHLLSICLIFLYKDSDSLAINDVINCSVSLFIGMITANTVTGTRLTNIQLNKDLTLRENTDFLTKLPNRKKLFQQFRSSVNFHGIIMVDIDEFKKYNDTYGHQQGDYALVSLASCLSAKVDKNLEFMRYGGEEFIGIYRGCSLSQMTQICKELNQDVTNMQISHSASQRGYMTISIGFYFSKEPIKDEQAIGYADIALYNAKENGKDTCVQYEDFIPIAENMNSSYRKS